MWVYLPFGMLQIINEGERGEEEDNTIKTCCNLELETICLQFLPRLSLTVDFYLPFTDNELLYRTREGDVVKLNVDTKERTVIVLKQLFVSIIVLQLTVLCS